MEEQPGRPDGWVGGEGEGGGQRGLLQPGCLGWTTPVPGKALLMQMVDKVGTAVIVALGEEGTGAWKTANNIDLIYDLRVYETALLGMSTKWKNC